MIVLAGGWGWYLFGSRVFGFGDGLVWVPGVGVLGAGPGPLVAYYVGSWSWWRTVSPECGAVKSSLYLGSRLACYVTMYQ